VSIFPIEDSWHASFGELVDHWFI